MIIPFTVLFNVATGIYKSKAMDRVYTIQVGWQQITKESFTIAYGLLFLKFALYIAFVVFPTTKTHLSHYTSILIF